MTPPTPIRTSYSWWTPTPRNSGSAGDPSPAHLERKRMMDPCPLPTVPVFGSTPDSRSPSLSCLGVLAVIRSRRARCEPADSRAELVWDVAGSAVLSPLQRERLLEGLSSRVVDGVLTITASEHRAQLRNRNAARARLAAVVADALRPPSPSRRPTSPSRGAKERRLEAKKRRTDVKRLRRPPHD